MDYEGGKRIAEWKRSKLTGRGKDHTFVALRHDMLRSPQFHALSGNALKLLLFFAAQYNGRNNGDLSMGWADLARAGWASEATARRARDELLEGRWIRITRHGTGRVCHLFAVTWQPVDECARHVLEVPSERVACDDWKRIDPYQNERTPPQK